MIYFTSDQHFGHDNILRYCNRPFANTNEMDAALIANWNSIVTENDDVYMLGDFTMRPAEDAHKYLTRLNGRKYFIRGNHDKFLRNRESGQYKNDFIWVRDYEMLHAERNCFVLFHYPILEWANYYRGSIHLYGHVHNSEKSAELLKGLKGLAFNVGVDVNGYCPVSIKTILNHASKVISQTQSGIEQIPEDLKESTEEKMNEIDCTKCKFYDKHCGGKCGYINCLCTDCIHRGNNPVCNIGESQIPANHFILDAECDNREKDNS